MKICNLKIYALLAALTLATPALPQSSVKIRGMVVDAASGEILPGANIQVQGTAFGAAADMSGRFEIENLLIGDYTLRFAFMGYEPQQKRVTVHNGETAFLMIRLQPAVLELQSIEIAAERDDSNISSGAILLTREMIERAGVENLGDLLKTVGGLQVIDDGGKKTIRIRGARANQTLVLLDGVKLNDPLTGEVNLAQTPLHSVETVEIKKGGAAEYGDGALGGVINIRTLAAGADLAMIGGQSGAYGYNMVQASLSYRLRLLNLATSVQNLDHQGGFPYRYINPGAAERADRRQNSDLHSRSLFGRIGFAQGAHSAALRLQAFTSDRGTPGKVHYLTPYARIESARRAAIINYAFVRDRWRLAVNTGRAWSEIENGNLRPQMEEAPFGPTPEFHFRSRLLSDNLDALVERRTAAWLQSVFGLDASRVQYEDRNLLVETASSIGNAKDVSFGAFIKQEYSFRRSAFRFVATPILRYDEATLSSQSQTRFDRRWNPGLRLFLSHGAEQQLYLRAEANRAFRMPTFADLFYQDFRVQGKPDLAPEKSRNIEIAVGAQVQARAHIHIDATFYQNRIEDMIVWRLGSFEFFRPYNTDAELRGGEVTVQVQTPSSKVGGDFYYSYEQALNKNNNQTLHNKMLPYRPEHSYKINFWFGGDRWKSRAALRGVGRRFITEANTKEAPSYVVLDWNVEWTLKIRRIDLLWRLAIFNLLDERYEILRDMPLPGREWRVGLAVRR